MLEAFLYYFQAAKEHMLVKIIAGLAVFDTVSIFDFFYGVKNQEMLIALFFLMVLDLLIALYTVKVTGHPIKSKNLGRGVQKFIFYYSFIAVGSLFDHTLFENIRFAEVTIVGYLAAQEVISFMEHGAALGYHMPQQLLNRLQEYTKQGTDPAPDKFTIQQDV